MVTDGRRPVAPAPYGDGALIRVGNSELAGWGVRRKLGNDCLLPWGAHNANLGGDGGAVYHGLAIGPVSVPAGESRTVHVALVCGAGDTRARARALLADAAEHAEAADQRLAEWASVLRRLLAIALTGAHQCQRVVAGAARLTGDCLRYTG